MWSSLMLGLSLASVPQMGTGLQFLPPEQLRAIPLAELPYAGFELPVAVDLSPHMPPPGLQGKQNSCVAWAAGYAVKTYQEKVEQRYLLVQAGKPEWKRIFSPAFIYNQINQGRDGGATLVDALNLLSGRGALSWSAMPYRLHDYLRQPTVNQLKEAQRYRIAYWRQVNVADPYELKAQLQAGYPVMIGALIDEGLHKLERGAIWKQARGRKLGGHAMVVVGYDDQRKAFKIMNSWGTRWADSGFAWIDYAHFARVVREGYVAKDARNTPLRDAAAPARQPSGGLSELVAPAEPATTDALVHKNAQAAPVAPPIYAQSEEEAFLPVVIRQQVLESGLLRFQGRAELWGQTGARVRVVVRLYQDESGHVPLSSPDHRYALANGSAVAASAELDFANRLDWTADIPLAQLVKPEGEQGPIWAQPVLYIDGFGVEAGPLVKLSF